MPHCCSPLCSLDRSLLTSLNLHSWYSVMNFRGQLQVHFTRCALSDMPHTEQLSVRNLFRNLECSELGTYRLPKLGVFRNTRCFGICVRGVFSGASHIAQLRLIQRHYNPILDVLLITTFASYRLSCVTSII
jgi:hypothetical protein